MFTLFVNGVPALKLSGIYDIPSPQGEEAWKVVNAEGRTIASYQPNNFEKHSTSKRYTTEPCYDVLLAIAA